MSQSALCRRMRKRAIYGGTKTALKPERMRQGWGEYERGEPIRRPWIQALMLMAAAVVAVIRRSVRSPFACVLAYLAYLAYRRFGESGRRRRREGMRAGFCSPAPLSGWVERGRHDGDGA